MNELYCGAKELFEGLWIYDQWDWEANQRPVIWLKFATFQYKDYPLRDAIFAGLSKEAERLGVTPPDNDMDHPLLDLLKKVNEHYGQKAVLLIDEYDKPIIDFLNDIPRAEANRDTLKWLYSVLKDSDALLEKIFITGVSAFSKVSIFSDLNHLTNLTLHRHAYTLLGITQKELETVFAEQLAQYDKEQVKRWYNGYGWGGDERVYNPFSLLSFLNGQEFNNFWFETGTPTFLIKEMIKHRYYAVSGTETTERDLLNFDFTRLNPVSVLFQTGYLTITKYVPEDLLYTLDYPNMEVKHSLEQLLLREYLDDAFFSPLPRVVKMRNALQAGDVDTPMSILNSLLAEIPGELWQGQTEHFYHAVVHLSFSLLGTYIRSEARSARGRCDALVETADHLYIFEFKLDQTAQAAMQQIHDKGYLTPYADSHKKVVAIGANFSSETKQIEEWVVK
ncbi:MAG: AAA family ATPase [Saprospiraceae bacterium]